MQTKVIDQQFLHHIQLSPTMVAAPAQKTNELKAFDELIQPILLKHPYSLNCPSLRAIVIEHSECFSRYSAYSKICIRCPIQEDCKLHTI